MTDFTPLPHQVPPAGPWKTWILLGGRGAGKTRGAGEFVKSELQGSLKQAGVMGPSRRHAQVLMAPVLGLDVHSPYLYSTDYPTSWRGFQFELLWLDEPLMIFDRKAVTQKTAKQVQREEHFWIDLQTTLRLPNSRLVISQNDLGAWPEFFAQLLKDPTTVLSYPESHNPHLAK